MMTNLSLSAIIVLQDDSKPFHVANDVEWLGIGCALLKFDAEDRQRVV